MTRGRWAVKYIHIYIYRFGQPALLVPRPVMDRRCGYVQCCGYRSQSCKLILYLHDTWRPEKWKNLLKILRPTILFPQYIDRLTVSAVLQFLSGLLASEWELSHANDTGHRPIKCIFTRNHRIVWLCCRTPIRQAYGVGTKHQISPDYVINIFNLALASYNPDSTYCNTRYHRMMQHAQRAI
jgi:hypothetical protein